MTKAQEDVIEFMTKAGQDCPPVPTIPPEDVRLLRVKLIAEELSEFCAGLGVTLKLDTTKPRNSDEFLSLAVDPKAEPDLVETYDALIDMEVVVVGGAVACGMDLEPGWNEVRRSNLTKFIDGHRREDGKWVKGPSYSPADLKPVLDRLSTASTAR